MSNSVTMGHIYDVLKRRGYDIAYDEHNPPPRISDDDRSPWYMQILMLCGGVISASFMIGIVTSFISLFLFNADPMFIAMLGIVLGIITIGGTILVASNSENVGAFKAGLLLPIHVVGHFMLIGGIGLLLTEVLPRWEDSTTIGFVFLIVGIIYLVTTTVAMRYFSQISTFASYLYLISHISGHGMALFGVMMAFELWVSGTTAITWCIVIIALQILFIMLYSNAIYRFLATLTISGALFAITFIIEYEFRIETAPFISVLIAALMMIAIIIWSDRLPTRWQIYSPTLLHPIAYGSILSTYALIIYEVSNRYRYLYTYNDTAKLDTTFITTALLFLGLILLEIALLSEYEVSIKSPYALAIYGISLLLALLIYAIPGILAAIIGIFLAFRRRNRIVLIVSNVYLAGFIIYYYYWLDVTLLTKSIILMTTGVLLIAARLLLRRIVIVPDEDEKGGESA